MKEKIKNLSIYIKIPLTLFILALIWVTVSYHPDETIVIIEIALLIALISIIIINRIPKPVKIVLASIISVVIVGIILTVPVIIALVLAGIINIVISKRISTVVKIVIITILVLFMSWISIMVVDAKYLDSFKEPIFAKMTKSVYVKNIMYKDYIGETVYSDDSTRVYKGIGYVITIKYSTSNPSSIFSNGEETGNTSKDNGRIYITQCEMYLFSRIMVFGWVT